MATLKLHQRRKRPRLGPFSSKQSLISVDGRCSVARAIRDFARELERHLGAEPTPAQRVLIREAAIKNARITMMSEAILDRSAPDFDLVTRCYLAWSNSLRRDLEALGLKPPEQQVPRIADFLSQQKRGPGRPPRVRVA
jgi:hypothetical protein